MPRTLAVAFLMGVLPFALPQTPSSSSVPAAQAPLNKTPLSEIPGADTPTSVEKSRIEDEPKIAEGYTRIRRMMDAGAYDQAAVELERLQKEARGEYFEIAYSTAICKFALEQFDAARASAAHAVALRPGSAAGHYLLGRLYQRAADNERAIKHFRSATLADAGGENSVPQIAAWLRLSDLLAERGYAVAAIEGYEEFDRAIWETYSEYRSDPEIEELLTDRPYGALEQRRELLLKLGKTEESVRIVRSFREGREDDVRLARLYVRALLDSGAAREALDFCRGQIRAAEKSRAGTTAASNVFLPLALDAARAAGQLQPWLTQVREEIGNGDSLQTGEFLARSLYAGGDFESAAALWKALLARAPANSAWTWEYAQALRQNRDLEGALRILADAVRADPQQADVRGQALENWLRTAVDHDAFLKLLADFERRPERDFATDFVLGSTAAAAGETELAGKLLQRAAEARPDFALAHVAWGRALLRDERWAEARAQAEAALAAQPDLPAASFVLGQALSGLDDVEGARRAYLAAVAKRPNEPEYAWALGKQFRRSLDENSLTSAERYLQQAATADPENGELREDLIETYLLNQKFELAREQYERARAAGVNDDSLRRISTLLRFATRYFDGEHLAELQRQFAAHPTDLRTALILAQGRLRIDPAQSASVLEQALTIDPKNVDALQLQAVASLRSLDAARAISILEGLTRRFPNRRGYFELLTTANMNDLRMDEARKVLRELLSHATGPERNAYFERIVETHALVGEFDEAFKVCREWTEATGDESAAGALLSLVARSERTPRELESQRDAIDQALSNDLSQSVFFDLCKDSDRIELLEWTLARLLAAAPDNPGLRLWKGYVLARRGQVAEAKPLLEPGNPNRLAQLISGLDLFNSARARMVAAEEGADQGVKLIDEMLASQPGGSIPLRREALLMLEDAGRFDDAIKHVDSWIEAARLSGDSNPVALLELRAMAALDAANDATYLESYERIVQSDGGVTNPSLRAILDQDDETRQYFNNFAYALLEANKDMPRALALSRRAIGDETLNGTYLDTLGWALYKNGDVAGAQRVLRKTAKLFVAQDVEVFDHLGDVEFCAGDKAAAAKAWQKAVEFAEQPRARRVTPPQKRKQDARVLVIRRKIAELERGQTPEVAPPGCK